MRRMVDWCAELEKLETEETACRCPTVPNNLVEVMRQLQPQSFGDKALRIVLKTLLNQGKAKLRSYSGRKSPLCMRLQLGKCGIKSGETTFCLRKPKRGCPFYWKGERVSL